MRRHRCHSPARWPAPRSRRCQRPIPTVAFVQSRRPQASARRAASGCLQFQRDAIGPSLDLRPVSEVAGGKGLADRRDPHEPSAQSLDRHDRLCVRVERSEEDPLVTGMDRLGELGELCRPGGLDHIPPLGVDQLGSDRAAAEQPDRTARQQVAMLPHESRGLGQPSTLIGGASDDEAVVVQHGGSLFGRRQRHIVPTCSGVSVRSARRSREWRHGGWRRRPGSSSSSPLEREVVSGPAWESEAREPRAARTVRARPSVRFHAWMASRLIRRARNRQMALVSRVR